MIFKELKVGKSYYVPKEKFSIFLRECCSVGIPERVVNYFEGEKLFVIEQVYDCDIIVFKEIPSHRWSYPKRALLCLKEYKNFSEEELEI